MEKERGKHFYVNKEIVIRVNNLFFEKTGEMENDTSFPDKLRVILGLAEIEDTRKKNRVDHLEVGGTAGFMMIRGETADKLKRRVRQYAYRSNKKFDFEERGTQVWVTRIK